MNRDKLKRALKWVLALAALAFVAYVVPIRDRCVDPQGGAKVSIVRDADGCILQRSSGPARLDAAQCSALACERGLASTMAHARVDWVVALFVAYIASTLAWSLLRPRTAAVPPPMLSRRAARRTPPG